MTTQTYFTLAEYKQNYDRLRDEFIDAYVDNEEEEFISLQIEWYQRCSENTKLAWGLVGDSIGWYPKILENGNGLIWEVNEKIRNKDGEIDQTAAQNLSVSFKKILNFLHLKQEGLDPVDEKKLTAAQWALYYYFLQANKIIPPFKEKTNEIKALSKEIKIFWKTFEMKFNAISNSKGLEGYSEKDVEAVLLLLKKDYPSLISQFEKLTLHVS